MPLTLSPTQIAFNARGDGGFSMPFAEQVAFLRRKLDLPTAHWDDILKAAHDRAFVVAGALKADLLADFHAAVLKTAAEGKSIQWFKKEFERIVARNGWQGWTGEDTPEGRDWRARVIYRTNLTTSHAAGRHAQLTDPELLQTRPYWKYVHNDTVQHPRELHQAWGRKPVVLKWNDPWWHTHYTPNGWGCRCRVVAVREEEYPGDPAPDDGTWTKTDRYGVTHEIPKGIDYGWDYAPGSKTDVALRTMVQDKLIRYPAAITKALSRDVNRYINAHEDIAGFAARYMVVKSQPAETLWLGFVENPAPIQQAIGVDTTGYLVILPSDAVNHVVKHHEWDGEGQRLATPEDYQRIQDVLSKGEILPGKPNELTGLKRLVAKWTIDGELFRAIFEARTGRKNQALALITLAIKTGNR